MGMWIVVFEVCLIVSTVQPFEFHYHCFQFPWLHIRRLRPVTQSYFTSVWPFISINRVQVKLSLSLWSTTLINCHCDKEWGQSALIILLVSRQICQRLHSVSARNSHIERCTSWKKSYYCIKWGGCYFAFCYFGKW